MGSQENHEETHVNLRRASLARRSKCRISGSGKEQQGETTVRARGSGSKNILRLDDPGARATIPLEQSAAHRAGRAGRRGTMPCRCRGKATEQGQRRGRHRVGPCGKAIYTWRERIEPSQDTERRTAGQAQGGRRGASIWNLHGTAVLGPKWSLAADISGGVNLGGRRRVGRVAWRARR